LASPDPSKFGDTEKSLSVKSQISLLIPPEIFSLDEIYLADCRIGKMGRMAMGFGGLLIGRCGEGDELLS